jgi:hypothetical protein
MLIPDMLEVERCVSSLKVIEDRGNQSLSLVDLAFAEKAKRSDAFIGAATAPGGG